MFGFVRCGAKAAGNILLQKRYINTKSNPVKVLVTGAAGQIGYSILPMIASGRCFGKDVPVELNMLDIPATENIMHGVRMELEDCAYDTLVKVNVFTKAEPAFKGIDYGIMLANKMVLTADIKRVDLLSSNKDLYTEMGEIFAKNAKPDAKILMVANPANTNCLIMAKNSPGRDYRCFTSLSRLDANRLGRMLATKLNVSVDMVRKYIIWGNHAASMHPDVSMAEYVTDNNPLSPYKPVTSIIEDGWVKDSLLPAIKDRAFEVIRARQKSSAMSAGNAAVDHIRDWHVGTREGHWASMGVYLSSEKYGLPKDIVFAMPCVCYEGKYVVADDLSLDQYTKQCLLASAEDLLEEKKLAKI